MPLENEKIAILLRTCRTALGWNQKKLADLTNVAKSTIARIETLEVKAKADFLLKAQKVFKDNGLTINFESDDINIIINSFAINLAIKNLK